MPKKGDLKLCDNWRSFSLLDVVGKVLGRIVQERLKMVAKDILSETKCGFTVGQIICVHLQEG